MLVHEMKIRKTECGLAAMGIGVGQGISTMIELTYSPMSEVCGTSIRNISTNFTDSICQELVRLVAQKFI
jgi:hypothetical protein